MEANEARQMGMLLQEGGIADDGTTVDPVSGNDVPPGSMAEEVRDDVPAQLSEGEYVVPADVTRYFGVKFFEDLRSEAKQGMGQMEADGRIGGEPVSQTMDNQAEGALTPDELAMLQEMGMNVGGMVPPPQAVGNTAEYNKGGQVLYANDGVDVATPEVDPYTAQFDAGMGANFGGGFLSQSILEQGAASRQSTTVTLYSPDGIAQTLILPAEQARYNRLLSEGYTTEAVATTTATTVGQDNDNSTTSSDGSPAPETVPVSDMTDKQLISSAKGLGLAGKIGVAVLGPVAGAAFQTVAAARANAIRQEAIDRNIPGAEDINYQGSVFGGQGGMYENLSDTSGDDQVNFADTWLGDLLGFDGGNFGVQGDGLKDSFGGSRRDTTSDTGNVSEANTPITTSLRPQSDPRKKAQTGGTGATASGAQGDGNRGGRTAALGAQATRQRNEDAGLGAQTKAGSMAGTKSGMSANEGGIVTKRTKKKKKK